MNGRNFVVRMVAVFGSNAFAALAGAPLIGVATWKASAIAGAASCFHIVQQIMSDFARHGKVTDASIAKAFVDNSPKENSDS
jgi:hypothetical protein